MIESQALLLLTGEKALPSRPATGHEPSWLSQSHGYHCSWSRTKHLGVDPQPFPCSKAISYHILGCTSQRRYVPLVPMGPGWKIDVFPVCCIVRRNVLHSAETIYVYLCWLTQCSCFVKIFAWCLLVSSTHDYKCIYIYNECVIICVWVSMYLCVYIYIYMCVCV